MIICEYVLSIQIAAGVNEVTNSRCKNHYTIFNVIKKYRKHDWNNITFLRYPFFSKSIHLYIAGDEFKSIQEMLQRQEKASRFDQFNRNSLVSVNVWIAYVRNENERKIFRDTLSHSPLRFDSHVFEFYEEGPGGFSFHIKLVAARHKVC